MGVVGVVRTRYFVLVSLLRLLYHGRTRVSCIVLYCIVLYIHSFKLTHRGMIFNGTITGSGFTHVPGGPEHADHSVFSFHYYCWWFTTGDGLERRTCDKHFGPRVFAQVGARLGRVYVSCCVC